MVEKDKRYGALKTMVESGDVKGLNELFIVLPVTVIRKDLGISYDGMSTRVNNSGRFNLEDLTKLAELIECDPMLIIKLAMNEMNLQKKKPNKK